MLLAARIDTGMARLRLTAALAAALVLALAAAPAHAGVANAGVPGASPNDPLAGLPWGNYTGQRDEVFPWYRQATGQDRALLAKIALRPRMRWFGSWYADDQAGQIAASYIDNVTGGNPNVLAQIAIFRMEPWEGSACKSLPTPAQQGSYRAWIDNFAQGIGSARVALVLQPDLPFGLCVPGHSLLPLHMIAYAAQVFSALPHTTVYIDAGSDDWASVGQASWLLRMAGVRYTRGFALNATHYETTANEIRYGAKVVRALAAAGVPGRHFVVNTSGNGRGFSYQQYRGNPYTFGNARVCQRGVPWPCVTLGIPPTANVSSPRWRLPAAVRRLAARYVDAYLWIGRPWLVGQTDPFDLQRALALAASTPF
jgi:endoglucanase